MMRSRFWVVITGFLLAFVMLAGGVVVSAQDALDTEAPPPAAVVQPAVAGEWLTVALFGVLLAVVGLLVYLLARLIPLLHESVSASNLKPLYDALLPLAKQGGTAAYDTLIAELRAIANKTPNTIDNALLAQLESLVDKIVDLEREKRGAVGGDAVGEVGRPVNVAYELTRIE